MRSQASSCRRSSAPPASCRACSALALRSWRWSCLGVALLAFRVAASSVHVAGGGGGLPVHAAEEVRRVEAEGGHVERALAAARKLEWRVSVEVVEPPTVEGDPHALTVTQDVGVTPVQARNPPHAEVQAVHGDVRLQSARRRRQPVALVGLAAGIRPHVKHADVREPAEHPTQLLQALPLRRPERVGFLEHEHRCLCQVGAEQRLVAVPGAARLEVDCLTRPAGREAADGDAGRFEARQLRPPRGTLAAVALGARGALGADAVG